MDGDRGMELSSDVFSMWILNWKDREIRIVPQAGEHVVEPMDASMPRPSEQIAVSIFDWDRWWLETVTDRGDFLFAEVWSPVGDLPKGRPSVYLDQNHWSAIARSIVRPDSLSEVDLVAAKRIAELAMDGGIRLPVSSGTLSETGRLFGDRRYEVGVVIAALSGGWQLRDPIEVRKQEFTAWFVERLGVEHQFPRKDVVTLEPRSVFGERVVGNEWEWANADTRLFLDAITWPSVLVSLLLDPKPTHGKPPERWAKSNQRMAEQMRTLTRKQRLSATTLAAINDNERLLTEALARLGDPVSMLARLVPGDIADAVTQPRFGGLYTEVMGQRLRDSQRRWKTNDLNDVMFLTCAAAYCDYVVAEKSTGHQIARILKARKMAANVFVTLPEVVEALQRDHVVTITEAESGSAATT